MADSIPPLHSWRIDADAGMWEVPSYSFERTASPPLNLKNQAKHGVSLSVASELDWDAAMAWADDRYEYGELRMIAIAPKTSTLYYVAFVDRGSTRRFISLRRANRREVKHYVENT